MSDVSVDAVSALDFAALFDLEAGPSGSFRGWCHQGSPMRAFGGQLAGQGFVAAAQTVHSAYAPASMHAYFASAASTEHPIDYLVEESRDGRSFATRSVTAVQRGQVVLVLLASFQRPEPGPSRQRHPEQAPAPDEDGAGLGIGARMSPMERALEQRRLSAPAPGEADAGIGQCRSWMRARRPIGDDALLHAGAVIYMTDMILPVAAVQPHAARSPGVLPTASLDHAVWFHGPVKADQWLLLDAHSPVLAGTRGLAIAHVYDEPGRLIASAAQDVLARNLDGS